MDFSAWTQEYFAANEKLCTEQLSKPEVRTQIPLLNCTPLHDLRDNALVRFRGMIQDMQDPECYLERYEVRRKGRDGAVLRVQCGQYRDVVVMNKDEEAVDFHAGTNQYGERRSMFVISVPGYNSWAVECEQKMNVRGCPAKVEDQSNELNNAKRPHADEEAMETDEPVGRDNSFKKPMLPAEPSAKAQQACSSKSDPSSNTKQTVLSAEYLLNSPIAERPSKACLVKLYSNYDDCTLNTLVDVVGFLSVDPALDGSTDQMDDNFEDEVSEHQATNPPPSLIPRIHAISFQKLKHVNPLLDTPQEPQCSNMDIWKDIQNLLTQVLFEDKMAADYLLCHLISTVYVRNEIESLGHFSLNLSNIPAEVLPSYTKGLYEIMELLLPASHYLPMTLENMNTMQFVPKKDYTTNKLTSGLLQLAPHTHLLLDETKLQTGKLETSGVEAVQSIAHLIKTQKLKYNFQFYQLEFDSDVPVLVLSEGKSMLPTNFNFPLVPDVDAVKMIEETLKAGKHFIQPKLTEMRKFLTQQRIQQFDMNNFDPEVIQNDFIQMRKDSDASAEDLHSLLVLARLLGLSRGKNSMDRECWEYAKQLEHERKSRMETFAKRRNEL